VRPRDEHDYEQRRQQIIDGALEVFSSKGFEKATNKEIARAAGIGSPGLIYHYFADKTDLLQQVMEQRAPVFQIFAHPENLMEMPPREALTFFGTNLLKILENRTAVAALKLIMSEVTRRPAVADIINRIGPGRGLPLLASYLERQMQQGVLRQIEPGAAARCFVGSLIAYIITREIFPQPDIEHITPEIMVTSAVEIFLHGMSVKESL